MSSLKPKYPSTLGNEGAVQDYIFNYSQKELGLVTEKFVPDLKRISKLLGYSSAEWSYQGRPVVVGQSKNIGPKIVKKYKK